MKKFFAIWILLSTSALVIAQKEDKGESQEFVFKGKVYSSQEAFIHAGHRCQQPVLEEYQMEAMEMEVQAWLQETGYALYGGDASLLDDGDPTRRSPRRCRNFNPPTIVIPVAWHIITDGNRGQISNQTIQAQLQVMNDAFQGSGFFFVTDSIERVNNRSWYNMTFGSSAERQCKRALNIDPERVLNVYTGGLGPDDLGWATFPNQLSRNPDLDGVVLLADSFPGGSAAPFNLGQTGTHEVGHWLGLFHTFQGGCRNRDRVADTPAQRSPTSGCPRNRDSCRNKPGKDDVSNYMDYSNDSCMDHFTLCQILRMHEQVGSFRGQL